jgi:hypothetical protein
MLSQSEHVYTDEEWEFIRAVEEYRRINHRQFPTSSEILEVAKCLGYRKVAQALPIPEVQKSSRRSTNVVPLPEADGKEEA